MIIILNQKNIIVQLDDAWNNNLIVPLMSLRDDAILGRSIFDFIQGDRTKMVIDSALSHSRAHNLTVHKHYRCDGPDVKRYFEMKLTPLPSSGMKAEHFLLKTEQQRYVPAKPDNAEYDDRLVDLITRCSICCRYLWEGSWLEIEDYIVIRRTLFSQVFANSIEYAVCDRCWNSHTPLTS
jgi:hypothetical protein